MKLAGSDVCVAFAARKMAQASAAIPLTAALVSATVSLAPPTYADLAGDLQGAVTQARAGSSCGPLRPEPVAQRVAAVINKSYSNWLAHQSTSLPIDNPVPGLRELGYRGNKGIFLGGVSKKRDADAIKGVMLEGYAALVDCSYTDYGVNMLRDEASGYTLAAAVLAGP